MDFLNQKLFQVDGLTVTVLIALIVAAAFYFLYWKPNHA